MKVLSLEQQKLATLWNIEDRPLEATALDSFRPIGRGGFSNIGLGNPELSGHLRWFDTCFECGAHSLHFPLVRVFVGAFPSPYLIL